MSSLGDRLKAMKPKQVVLTIDDNRYLVTSLTASRKSEILAESRDAKGKMINDKLEGLFLSECITDDATGERFFTRDEWKEWGNVSSSLTGPLVSEAFKICGMDDSAVGREVKNSDTTGNSGSPVGSV